MLGMSVKMVFEAYEDEKFTKKASPHTFTLQINPESFTLSHATAVKTEVMDAKTEAVDKPKIPSERTLSLNFPLDQSGVMLLPIKNRVLTLTKTIELFLKVCIEVNGNIHTNNYLVVRWGNFSFKCRCESADIKYTLFNPLGKPVRAVITAKFKEFIDRKTEQSQRNNNSPDMSHLVTIRQGDSLPALCESIYGDPKYYLQVARVNDLVDFRRLEPGSRILFPRLEQ